MPIQVMDKEKYLFLVLLQKLVELQKIKVKKYFKGIIILKDIHRSYKG